MAGQGTNDPQFIAQTAELLDNAALNCTAVDQVSQHTPFDLDTAYAIQKASVGRRVARGETHIGVKLGFTSLAKMKQMGVDSLIWGPLTSAMLRDDGTEIDIGEFVHPRAEPEICFLTRKDISNPLSTMEACQAVDGVAPAIEIIDSRYQNFKFSLEDVVADNCSSSGLVVGPMSPLRGDLSNLGVVLMDGGHAVEIGSSAAVLGNPLRAVVSLSRLLAETGQVLPAGSLIMSGGATSAHALAPGKHISVAVHDLGRAEFWMV